MPKIELNKAEVQAKTGLTIVYSYLLIFAVNYIVLILANTLFPSNVVLGTYALTVGWSAHHAAAKIALITILVLPFVYYHEWKRGSNYTPREWMTLYFVVNVLSVWLISRFAEVFGLGISNWWVALLLGAALDWAQGMAMMAVSKYQK